MDQLMTHVVMGVSGQPFDAFDQEAQADGYAAAVNKAAGSKVVFVVAVPRNPAWSSTRAPGKVAETAVRAVGKRAA